jgi:hypothetical protein
MPKLVACLAGFVALLAGIFGNVEPALCLQRALVALVSGWCCGALWAAITSVPVQLTVMPGGAPSEDADAETTEGEQAKAA